MSLDVYKNMLSEEIDRKKRAKKSFLNDISVNKRMPIYFKRIKGKEYIYINDGKKGNFHYKLLGNINSFSKDELSKLKFNAEKYKDNINKINEINEDIEKLERIVGIIG